MKYRETVKKGDFFTCLRECTKKARRVIRKCFEDVIILYNKRYDEEYDLEKADKGLFLTKFEIKDEKREFECKGEGLGGTPKFEDLLPTIDHLKALLRTIGLYSSPSFPDEALHAHIVMEHQKLEKPHFRVRIQIRKGRNDLYQGSITTRAEFLIEENEEIEKLLDKAQID